MNDTLNIPYLNGTIPEIPTTDATGIKGASLNNISHVNYYAFGFSGAGSAGQLPCVHWFGEDYPNTSLYERSVNSSGSVWQFRDRYLRVS